MEADGTSKTSVCFNETTRRYIPECCPSSAWYLMGFLVEVSTYGSMLLRHAFLCRYSFALVWFLVHITLPDVWNGNHFILILNLNILEGLIDNRWRSIFSCVPTMTSGYPVCKDALSLWLINWMARLHSNTFWICSRHLNFRLGWDMGLLFRWSYFMGD
jgi:hypothetical protein